MWVISYIAMLGISGGVSVGNGVHVRGWLGRRTHVWVCGLVSMGMVATGVGIGKGLGMVGLASGWWLLVLGVVYPCVWMVLVIGAMTEMA